MNTTTNNFDSPIVLAAACANGIAGVIVFVLMPMLLGACADHLQLTDIETGSIASAYFFTYALVTLTSVIWVKLASWRLLSRIGYAIFVAGLLLALLIGTYRGLIIGMGLAGIGAAAIFSLSFVIISERSHKDRGFAIKMIPEQLFPAALLFVFSSFFISLLAFSNFLMALIVVVISCSLFSFWIPEKGNVHSPISAIHGSARGAVFIGLIALLIYFIGFTGLWAFLERIAAEGDMDKDITGQLLTIGLIGSAAGPFIAAMIEDRFGRTIPIIIALLLSIVPLVLLGNLTTLKYGVVVAVLPTAYYFGLAYFFGIIADADKSGRFVGLIPFALAVGALIGPAVFGFIKAMLDLNSAYIMTGIAIIVGACLAIWTHRINQQQIELAIQADLS